MNNPLPAPLLPKHWKLTWKLGQRSQLMSRLRDRSMPAIWHSSAVQLEEAWYELKHIRPWYVSSIFSLSSMVHFSATKSLVFGRVQIYVNYTCTFHCFARAYGTHSITFDWFYLRRLTVDFDFTTRREMHSCSTLTRVIFLLIRKIIVRPVLERYYFRAWHLAFLFVPCIISSNWYRTACT